MNILRILVDVVVLIAVFFLPWWFFLILIPLLIFYFSAYYEILFFALLLDGLYGVSDKLWNVPFLLYASLVFLVSLYLKRRLAFYS